MIAPTSDRPAPLARTGAATDALVTEFAWAELIPPHLALLSDPDGLHVTVPDLPALAAWGLLLVAPEKVRLGCRGWLGSVPVTVEVQS